jgi:hypothetical protein
MVIVPNPAALKVWQLNFALDDVGKDVWERAFGTVESGHESNLEGGGGLGLHQYLGELRLSFSCERQSLAQISETAAEFVNVGDELFADIAFGELFLIQKSARWPILKLIGNELFLTILVTV